LNRPLAIKAKIKGEHAFPPLLLSVAKVLFIRLCGQSERDKKRAGLAFYVCGCFIIMAGPDENMPRLPSGEDDGRKTAAATDTVGALSGN
jgi:hypothetical protein